MKSAYEIAMARLEKETGPTKSLTDEQRAEIADIEKRYEARIAEERLGYDAKIAQVESPQEAEALRTELADKVASLEAERDRKKEAVWGTA